MNQQQGPYTVGAAWLRFGMMAALVAVAAWAGWLWNPGPEPLDPLPAMGKAFGRWMTPIFALFVPWLLKDLWQAYRFRRMQREHMERVYRSSGRHDTGLKPWGGAGGSAPDGWE